MHFLWIKQQKSTEVRTGNGSKFCLMFCFPVIINLPFFSFCDLDIISFVLTIFQLGPKWRKNRQKDIVTPERDIPTHRSCGQDIYWTSVKRRLLLCSPASLLKSQELKKLLLFSRGYRAPLGRTRIWFHVVRFDFHLIIRIFLGLFLRPTVPHIAGHNIQGNSGCAACF